MDAHNILTKGIAGRMREEQNDIEIFREVTSIMADLRISRREM